MAWITPLLVVLCLAGCGAEDPSGAREPSTPAELSTATRETVPNGPPKILLTSEAGVQVAVQGSFCGPSNGAFMCVDTREPEPAELSVVRQGTAVSIRLVGSRVLRGSQVAVQPYGCGRDVLESFRLDPGDEATVWEVSLPPGEYELQVFARFGYGKAGKGDVSGALGLGVDESAAIAVEPGPPRRC